MDRNSEQRKAVTDVAPACRLWLAAGPLAADLAQGLFSALPPDRA
jgi:hypothetical protein